LRYKRYAQLALAEAFTFFVAIASKKNDFADIKFKVQLSASRPL